ncbi:MAG: ABC-F family ATP-binding cassette domain-containing protein [Clostridia bacterium]|nr:ABC-F family ATP-binding cassette domain-containing protein [Clostridia bacterium]
MSILDVENLSLTFDDKVIFHNASMQLFGGDKMGLTGLNGTGKTTFINMLTQRILPDKGSIRWNPRMTLGYIDQQLRIDSELTVRQFLRTAFAEVYDAAQKLEAATAELETCRDEARIAELVTLCGNCQSLMEQRDYYGLDAEIEKTAVGLGIAPAMLDTSASKLSGGQRAKAMLALLLLKSPDILVLDEPTNFLDVAHITWLIKYLNAFKGAYIIVSHDYAFLAKVTTCICDIENGQITRYNGDYDAFAKQKEERRLLYEKQYAAQQKQIAKLQDFVDRNLVRASTSKQAKSRRKELEKMDRLAKPTDVPDPTFAFRFQPITGQEVLVVNDLVVGYDQPLLPEINLRVKLGEKIAVTGFNGIGKTTFLKTICGILPALDGSWQFHPKASVGYYEQESVWEQPDWTALQYVKEWFPSTGDTDIRKLLARCGLSARHLSTATASLSGGEQAKVKLCHIIMKPYTLLVLDEPTNHLDVPCVERLKQAIADFAGSVIFVSHDKNFVAEVADRVIDLEKLFD